MAKNFVWGGLTFILNLFLIYQNYTKNFTFDNSFFIEINQLLGFMIGLLYANQYRKFNLKYNLGLLCNNLVFSILISMLFGIYGAPVIVNFTVLLFIFMSICSHLGYTLFYILFCPKKYTYRKPKKAELKYTIRRNMK